MEERLFEQASQKPAGPERDAFLDQSCGTDPALRHRLKALLHAHDNPATKLEPESPLMEKTEGTISLSFPLSEAEGAWIGRYKLLQKIGEGGMGVVYMAEQEEPVRRRVALKIIKLGMDSKQVVARFEAERQALALMDHPNIARVLDAGATETGRPYFVMELVQGIPITEFCDRNKLSAQERLKLFLPVCNAIQSAHQKGVIHRDIKPTNVLVTINHGAPEPKVIDFGIAKATNQKLTEKTLFTNFGAMIGTPAYMSPEQAEMSSLDVDTRADVYSLGALLYELLTGSVPFPEKRLRSLGYGEMQRVIMEEEPERPSTRLSTMNHEERATVVRNRGADLAGLGRALKGDLDWVVMKCLEKDRRRRYETVNGLASDIERHMANEAVIARPPSQLYQLQKMVRRHRAVFAGAAAVALTLAAGIIVSTSLALWATRERADAITARHQAEDKALAETKAKTEATEQKTRAEFQTEQSRQRLAQMNTMQGIRLLEQGSYFESLLWFYQALQADSNSPARANIHRLRLGFVLAACPKLVHLWRTSGGVTQLGMTQDGNHFYTFSPGDELQQVQLFEMESGRPELPLLKLEPGERALAFQATSKLALTVDSTNLARIRDLATGEVKNALQAFTGPAQAARFSREASRVLVVESNTVGIWDVSSGKLVGHALSVTGEISYAGFSPDAHRVVIASCTRGGDDRYTFYKNTRVRIWDSESGAPISPLIDLGLDRIKRCIFSPDGKILVAASYQSMAACEVQTGRALGAKIDLEGDLNGLEFSPDGLRVVTATGDIYSKGCARVWAVRTGKAITPPLRHRDLVIAASFSPEGSRIVTTGKDKVVRIWDAETGLPLTPELTHEAQVVDAEFTPEGRRVLSVTGSGTVRLWDLAGVSSPLLIRHPRRVKRAEFSADGTKLVTGCYDGAVHIWDVDTGRAIGAPLPYTNVNRVVFEIGLSANAQRLMSVGSDLFTKGEVRIWDLAQSRLILRLPADGAVSETNGIDHACLSPDGKELATTEGAVLRLWDAMTGQQKGTAFELTGELNSLGFSPDGTQLLTICRDNTARLWEKSTGKQLIDALAHPRSVTCAVFSRDGQRVATGCEDGALRVWNSKTGRLIASSTNHSAPILSIAFSPDGERVVATAGWATRVYRADSAQPLTPWMQQEGEVDGATFNPAGTIVVSKSYNQKSVCLWDAATGQILGPPLKHADNVDGALFHSDNQRLLTFGNSARIWRHAADERSAEDLRALYQLLSSQHVDRFGSVVDLDGDELANTWRDLSLRYPAQFSVSKDAEIAWLKEQAAVAESVQSFSSDTQVKWTSAVFFLKRLLEATPGDAEVLDRLQQAESFLRNSKEKAND